MNRDLYPLNSFSTPFLPSVHNKHDVELCMSPVCPKTSLCQPSNSPSTVMGSDHKSEATK